MFSPITLENLIRTYVRFSNNKSGGFEQVLCKVCNDHGRKGLRAGFKFDNGNVGYNCFNCGIKAKYTEGGYLSDNMVFILESFLIPDEEINKLRFNNLGKKNEYVKSEKVIQFDPKEIELPTSFYYLSDAKDDDKWAEIARYYLEDRKIEPDSYPFMMSADDRWKKRIIVPIYKQSKLIYFTARALVESIKRYDTPAIAKNNILYGFEQIFANSDKPLFITEGFFDAYHINGIALMGKELYNSQEYWLNQSPRTKVFIPDKTGGSWRIAERFLRLGWSICTPDFGSSVEDVNSAIIKYNKMVVKKILMESIHSGELARVNLQFYCKDYGSNF